MPDIGANGHTCVCPVPYTGQDCSQGNNDEDDDGDDDDEEEDDNDDCDNEFLCNEVFGLNLLYKCVPRIAQISTGFCCCC